MFLISVTCRNNPRSGCEVRPGTLMHAHDAGQIARITCARCRVTRCYKPAELHQVIGNVTIGAEGGHFHLAYQRLRGEWLPPR